MEKQNLTTGFQQVDNSQQQFLIKFLEDVAAHPMVKDGFETQLQWMDIREGNHVLDVGCGIGVQAQEMAKLVGANGKVTGTDISNAMIDAARNRADAAGLPLEFLTADAAAQPFADRSFDAIRTERVLMYVKDPRAVLQEFKRLLKPGGRAVLFDFDWDAITIAHRDKALTRKIIRYASDSFPNGKIGSELFRMMKQVGFRNVRTTPSSYAGEGQVLQGIVKRVYEGILQTGVSENVFTAEAINNWWNAFDEDGQTGEMFMSFQGFISCGIID